MGNLQLLELQNPSKTQIKNKYHLGNNFATLSDKDLLALCQKYGTQAILWKRKFIGLLPEVDRRKLYEKKKCVSIYEFAAKFGGVTKKHTQRVIQIDKVFEENGVKILREMLQEGTASISKLIKVVSVVTVENESDIVTAVRNLSHESLETYVRDMRRAPEAGHDENISEATGGKISMFMVGNEVVEGGDSNRGGDMCGEIENGFPKPSDCPKSVRPNTFAGAVALKKLQLNLSEEVLEELLGLQGTGIDIDVLLKEFLQKRKEEIAERKEKVVEEDKEPLRYVSVKVKKILKEEFGTKCAVNGCNKAATQIHHTVPFALSGSNDPNLLKPLCRAHHDIVHSINVSYLEKKGMG